MNSVHFLYNFLITNKSVGPYGKIANINEEIMNLEEEVNLIFNQIYGFNPPRKLKTISKKSVPFEQETSIRMRGSFISLIRMS